MRRWFYVKEWVVAVAVIWPVLCLFQTESKASVLSNELTAGSFVRKAMIVH